MKIKYKETSKFSKEFKKFCKKYKTLGEDFQTAKENTIELFHVRKIDNRSIFEISDLKIDKKEYKFFKVKKFACRGFKGSGNRSGFRIIYAFKEWENIMEITFLEMYHKSKKSVEERGRIRDFLSSCPTNFS